jgi:hypothetical protein
MAREPEEPKIADLRRYRKAREQAARKPPPRPQGPREPLMGSNPRAGLILVAVLVVIVLLYVGPRFL